MVYTIGLILPVIFYIGYGVLENISHKSISIVKDFMGDILFLYYLVLTIFRNVSVGADTPVYFARYSIINSFDWTALQSFHEAWAFEYGFLVINKLLGFISENPYFLLISAGTFILFSFRYAIRKYSMNPFLSYYFFVVLVFFATSMNIMRLFIAMSICIYSIKYINEKKIYKFLLLVILASTFHFSSIIFMISYLINYFKLSRYNLIVFSVSMVVLYIVKGLFLVKLIGAFSSVYAERYAQDITSGSGLGMLLFLIGTISIALIYRNMYISNDLHKNDKYRYLDLWIKMLLLAIPFNIVALDIEIAARMMWYFKLAVLFLIPNVLEDIKLNSYSKIIFFFISIIFLLVTPLFYYFPSMSSDNFGINPYKFMDEI